jgi:HTH-type transcriptional regulator/antitoxin HigA
MLNLALVQIREALAQVPYIARINNEDDYVRALKLMDELVDDYDTNKQLIELLETSIERWEDGANEFADFNKAVAGGEALLPKSARKS